MILILGVATVQTDHELLISKDNLLSSLVDNIAALPPLRPYDELIFRFCKSLSKKLLKPENKGFPEVVSLGFWLREQIQLLSTKATHGSTHPVEIEKALGMVVHFTPRNVDTMFVYSWICGLMMGNKNIIRVASQRNNAAQLCMLSAIQALFSEPDFQPIAERNGFVSVESDSKWPAKFSQLADARVIWGGDDSVNAIRSLPTKPRSRDISFADRYSAALLDAREKPDTAILTDWAKRLWTDTHPHEQQACSSPKLVFWLGGTEAQMRFFQAIDDLASSQYSADDTLRNEQLVFSQYSAAETGAYSWQGRTIQFVMHDDVHKMLPAHNGQMTYLVITLKSLEQLKTLQTEKLQTLTYAGKNSSAFIDLIQDETFVGIDRIVPLGEALNFSTTWDGMELLSMLSRRVTVSL